MRETLPKTFRFGDQDRARMTALREGYRVTLNAQYNPSQAFRLAIRHVDQDRTRAKIKNVSDAETDGIPGSQFLWLAPDDMAILESIRKHYDLKTISHAARFAVRLESERLAQAVAREVKATGKKISKPARTAKKRK